MDLDRRYGLIAGAAVTVLLILGILGVHYVGSGIARNAAYSDFLAQADALRAGPVLFVPLEGNVCRQRVIDNETWRMHDAGRVICDEAVTWNATLPGQKYFVTVRVDAIRAGFRVTP